MGKCQRGAVLAIVVAVAEATVMGCTTNNNTTIINAADTGTSSEDATTADGGADTNTAPDTSAATDTSTADSQPSRDAGDAGSSDAGSVDASDSGATADSASSDSEADATEAGEPPGCVPDPSVCPKLGAADCTGWDCDAGLAQLGNEQCVRAGEMSMLPGDTAFACGPYVISGYIGDPAGNGCIGFGGNWCGQEFGSPPGNDAGVHAEYVCPLDGGPPALSACIDIGNDTNDTSWCCNTQPTCSPWGASPQCSSSGSMPQTYLGFGGAVPVGCSVFVDGGAQLPPQSILYCCPVSTDGGPACQP